VFVSNFNVKNGDCVRVKQRKGTVKLGVVMDVFTTVKQLENALDYIIEIDNNATFERQVLPNNIGHYRVLRGMTAEALALAIGTKQSAITRLEKGMGVLTERMAIRIADALGMSDYKCLFDKGGEGNDNTTKSNAISV